MWKRLILIGLLVSFLAVMAISFPPNPIQSEYGDMSYAVIGGKPYILFNNSFVNLNITLGLRQGGDYVILPNAPFFHLDGNDTFKYGLNVSLMLPQPVRVKYIINSNKTIHSWAFDSYYIPKNDTSSLCYDNPFEECDSKDPRLYFAQVCDPTLNESNEVVFDPECEGNLTNNNQTLELFFTIPAGLLNIDPTVTFSNSDVEGIAMDTIDNDEYILVWCDETQDDVTFAIYYTNGTLSEGISDVDSSVGSCPFVSDHIVDVKVISTETETASVIYIGSAGTALTRVFAYRAFGFGPSKTATSSKVTAVTLSKINDSYYVGAWIDSSQQDATMALFDINGNNATGHVDIDTVVGKTTASIDSTSFEDGSHNFSVIYTDDSANAIRLASFTVNFTVPTGISAITPGVSVDSGHTTGYGAVSVDSYTNNAMALAWLNNNGFIANVKYTTYSLNLSKLISTETVEASAGSSTSVQVQSINSSDIIIAWDDVPSSDALFEIWDTDGNRILDETSAFSSLVDGTISIASANHNDEICEDNFLMASTNLGINSAQIKSFLRNGSVWDDGKCVCEYTDYLNWNPPCDCVIVDNQTLVSGSTLVINGSGNFNLTQDAIISGYDTIDIFGDSITDRCYLNVDDGGGFQ